MRRRTAQRSGCWPQHGPGVSRTAKPALPRSGATLPNLPTTSDRTIATAGVLVAVPETYHPITRCSPHSRTDDRPDHHVPRSWPDACASLPCEGAEPLPWQRGRYPGGVTGGRLMAPRLAFAVIVLMAIVGMHGSAAEAHGCGLTEHAAQTEAGHLHDPGHEPASPSGSTVQHCASMACTAVVAPATHPGTTRVSPGTLLRPVSLRSSSGTLAAPEPPVPRFSLHT
jgi:hypothetical protein